MEAIKCIECKNRATESTTTHKTAKGIVIENVPCFKCDNCGEIYYDDKTVERIELIVARKIDFKTALVG